MTIKKGLFPFLLFVQKKIVYKQILLGTLKRIQFHKTCAFFPTLINVGLKIKKLPEKGSFEVYLKKEDRYFMLSFEGGTSDISKTMQNDRRKREPIVRHKNRLRNRKIREFKKII